MNNEILITCVLSSGNDFLGPLHRPPRSSVSFMMRSMASGLVGLDELNKIILFPLHMVTMLFLMFISLVDDLSSAFPTWGNQSY